MRAGFTLVETLVALVLFQIGMLAVAATGAIAARDIAIARRTAQARESARNHIEILRTVACATPQSGSLRVNGTEEFWSVTGAGASRTIVDSVSFPLPAGRRAAFVVRTAVLCDA